MHKILLGINTYPGHAFCRNEYVESIKKIIENTRYSVEVYVLWNGNQTCWGFDGFNVDKFNPAKSDRGIDILCKKQNIIRKYALDGGFTHLFMSETDVLHPCNILNSFVEHDKDMVTSPYMITSTRTAYSKIPFDNPKYEFLKKYNTDSVIFVTNDKIPCIWGLWGNRSRLWGLEDLFPQRGLVRVISSGIGAMMIKRKVLEEVGSFMLRSADTDHQQFTDYLFCIKAYQMGFQLFADTDIISNHLHYDFDETQMFTNWFNPNDIKDLGLEPNPYSADKYE